MQFNLTNTIIVVGEDVDLLVLLAARTPTEKTIFFLKPGKAQHQSEIYTPKSLLSSFAKSQNHILFLHAITGCDTTSAFYRRGKKTVFKMFEKQNLVECAEVFQNCNSTQHEIITSGIRFLLSMYGAKKTTCLDKHRYACFVKKTKSKKQVQLACLPPTSAAAHQHLLRVYYQVQVWLGCQKDPTD